MLEEDRLIQCPFCSTEFSIRIDRTGGRRQSFVYGCENCCRPIDVSVTLDGDDTDVRAESGE